MNLVEAIQSVDMDEIIDRMNAYAISRLKNFGLKDFEGKEPFDFVSEVILKVIEGTRDWEKAQCSFKEFLFGCLKSEISNFFASNTRSYEDELPEVIIIGEQNDFEEKKSKLSVLLKDAGADDDELIVFECWMDDIYKPQEISDELGIGVKNVYNIIKRLERRLPKIQLQAKSII